MRKTKIDAPPVTFYPFGHRGKKYTGQKSEIIACPKCKKSFEVSIMTSEDPEYIGYCHARDPNVCPHCEQSFWYRDGFERV